MNNQKYTLVVNTLNLPSHYSIADLFAHFADKPWAMLLDSADSQRQDGRFDIMVANPIATIATKGTTSTVWQQKTSQSQESLLNPLSLVQSLLEQLMPSDQVTFTHDIKFPFMAGALGLFGYDLGKRFESLPNKNANEYSTPDMAVGIYGWSIIKDNLNQQFHLCYLEQYSHPSIEDIQQLVQNQLTPHTFSLTSHWQANMSQDQYTQKLTSILSYLEAGDCYQINLAQRFSAHYTGDEWQAYQDLRVANLAPFSAFIRLDDSVVMSISPERFLSVNERMVQTKPIKGTRPRSIDSKQDQQQIESLLNSEKDRAENLMIVDLLRNDLSKHCQPGSVKVPELFNLESFAAVHHLVSTVTGQLKSTSSPLDLLQGAFPGGSITGAPKIRAMQIIDELEPNNRNIYCGSIGYLGVFGDMDTNICIRTLLCEQSNKQQNIHCWAGGGIVLDSNAKDEYQESLDKVSKILPILTQDSTLAKQG
ncbi:aminodeoxychorismate synthase component I [Paraglaciecola arctica]|uniref:aminodeoxychorismate synthase n=1 Tax=Paraglaciecola arctica BSs20135 TaxID=493475 RepID=K6Y7L9_9ALTE|nr:aminodeoxychorismate synthase component I [Paraglaciecola arctica]GAC19936.1 para-aminobenzoate synthetase component I [Paraglaciecola arctica BSs20135]